MTIIIGVLGGMGMDMEHGGTFWIVLVMIFLLTSLQYASQLL